MPYLPDRTGSSDMTRPLVMVLFAASCLLSLVSWYTTQQGMALYLSPWFALLASLGIQTALVITAWLVGITRERRALLVTVYVCTAMVSIAFSYVSLYTWFSARERPAEIERKLYDALGESAMKADQLLTASAAEQQKHVLALDEMTAAEKKAGYISRAQDADPYLARVREAVAREAQTYSSAYREGSGEGLRYTAFDRYSRLARQSLDQMRDSQRALAVWRAARKPTDPSEKQIRDLEGLIAAVPWTDVEQARHSGAIEKPSLPNFASYVDRTTSNQEDLLVAFDELASNASGRPAFSLALAAFIDVVIFLLAWAAGPHMSGPSEQRWWMAGAAIDGADPQIFLRGFLRKMYPATSGGVCVASDQLTPGEQQLCLALSNHRLAVITRQEDRLVYLVEENTHQVLLSALATPSFSMRAAAPGASPAA